MYVDPTQVLLEPPGQIATNDVYISLSQEGNTPTGLGGTVYLTGYTVPISSPSAN